MNPMYPGDDAKFSFGRHDRLRKAMSYAGVGVSEMAEALEVSSTTVGNWINGRNWPRQRDLKAFALRTGYPVEWLETGTLSNPDPGTGKNITNRLLANNVTEVSFGHEKAA